MVNGDDDPNDDFESAPATVLDGAIVEAVPLASSEPVTAPHDVTALPGYEVGRRAGREEKAKVCYEEGQEDALASVRREMLTRGLTREEVDHFVLAARLGLTRL